MIWYDSSPLVPLLSSSGHIYGLRGGDLLLCNGYSVGDRALSPVAMATLVRLNIHLGGSSIRKWIDAELAHLLKDMSIAIKGHAPEALYKDNADDAKDSDEDEGDIELGRRQKMVVYVVPLIEGGQGVHFADVKAIRKYHPHQQREEEDKEAHGAPAALEGEHA